jgi:hypothetical protein
MNPALLEPTLAQRTGQIQTKANIDRIIADGGEVLSRLQIERDLRKLAERDLLSKFSTLYTPNARKAGKLYSLVSAAGDATVSRASEATVKDRQDEDEVIANNVPSCSWLESAGRFGAFVRPADGDRVAENISLTGASDLIGQESGFLYALVDVRDIGLAREILRIKQSGSLNNAIIMTIPSTNRLTYIQRANSLEVFRIAKSSLITGIVSILITYNESVGGALYINGIKESESLTPFSFSSALSEIILGYNDATGLAHFNDHIFLAGNGTTALTESEALTLSSLFV